MADRTEPLEPLAVSPWRNPRIRAIVYQALVLGGVILLGVYLVTNTLANLEQRSIRAGFGFLGQEAGFDIGETPFIAYSAVDSYGRAFVVGILNTLRVAVLGIILATVIGTVMGVARLSGNWLIARLSAFYVEVARNVPLLLQLFFWYGLIGGVLPIARDAFNPLPGVFLSNSGLHYGFPASHPVHPWMAAALAVAVLACVAHGRWARRRQAETGVRPPVILPCLAMLIGGPLIAWIAGGAPMALDLPAMGTFRLTGGANMTPEFLALLLGLSLYTAGYIAEIVRSGILAVPRGQTEAARALGLRPRQVLRLVVLPQALRVIVPPATSQYLNLTKNSSLAVAIGYPDLVSIGNTSLNQTGQAVECVSIMMGCYLLLSLLISLFMNWYNARIALAGR
jgi:general L-amino acid transport system permease protein